MSRVVNYTEAAEWPEDEVQDNLDYLETRGRTWELEQAKALLGGADPGETPSAASDDEVPDGTVEEVLAWVGDDKDRAARALDAELDGKDRTTLVEALEGLAAE